MSGLTGCSSLQVPAAAAVYDFGPGPTQVAPADRRAGLGTLLLGDVEAGAALDSNAVWYRLAYSDSQQLRPYGLARWSMPPARLIQQRLRETLGVRRTTLRLADGVAAPPGALVLQVSLEEFSQVFETASHSVGLVRLRATVSQPGATPFGAGALLAQRSFVVRSAAASADARGGVQALTAATDAVLLELDQWLQQVQQSRNPPTTVPPPPLRP